MNDSAWNMYIYIEIKLIIWEIMRLHRKGKKKSIDLKAITWEACWINHIGGMEQLKSIAYSMRVWIFRLYFLRGEFSFMSCAKSWGLCFKLFHTFTFPFIFLQSRGISLPFPWEISHTSREWGGWGYAAKAHEVKRSMGSITQLKGGFIHILLSGSVCGNSTKKVGKTPSFSAMKTKL